MSAVTNPIQLGANPSFHPVMQSDLCLNRKQNKFVCTDCSEVCPKDVFSADNREEPGWAHCIDCGLCVTACPSRCFTPSSDTQRTLLDGVHPKETVILACEQEPELLERKVRCLGAIPWELLGTLSFYSEVVLVTGHCAGCENAACRELLELNLNKLRTFLGMPRFEQRIHLQENGTWHTETSAAEKEVSRREIFSSTLQSLKKTVYQAAVSRMPQLDLPEKDSLQYRRLLSRAIVKEREQLRKAQETAETQEKRETEFYRYTVSLPAYTSSCFGCSICERICPQKAIDVTAEPDGKRLIYITPWKCTECGLCAEICPHEGLKGLREISVPYLERLPLVRVHSLSCEKCGTAIKPGTSPALCPGCKAKNRRLRR